MDMGLGSWTRKRAVINSTQTAIVDPFRRYSYREWHERCCRLARWMRAVGVRHGDRVAALLLNGHQFLEVMFASAKLGAVFAPVNVRLPQEEVSIILANLGPKLVFHHSEFGDLVAGSGLTLERDLLIDCGAGEYDAGRERYEALLPGHEPEDIDADVSLDDLQIIIHSSGTTGRPKPVMLTHGNMLWNAIQLLGRTPLGASDRLLTSSPMFHIGGLNALTIPAIYAGAAVHILPSFDARAALETIQRERITCVFGLPTMWLAMVHLLETTDYDISSARFLMSGGAPCPLKVIEFLLGRNIELVQRYGLSEAAPIVAILDPKDARRKHGSVGVPAMHLDVRLVDDQGRDVGPGEVGELLCRGPNVSVGYWNNPELTRQAFRDGWLRTGDLARRDDEGYIYIVDRTRDVIVCGGTRLYPTEIEQTIYACPGVAEAAVFGLPHPFTGEAPCVAVVPKPGAHLDTAVILDHCAGKLEPAKTPRKVFVRDALPKSGSGKILKAALREIYAQPVI